MNLHHETLEKLANQILSLHNFKSQNFTEAKCTLEILNPQYVSYTFDRLSLFPYSHTLSRRDWHTLGQLLTEKYRAYNREDQKKRMEYGALKCFIDHHPEWRNCTICKEDRPDFVLHGSQKLGIEVVRLTTPDDQVLQTISNQDFGAGKSIEQVRSSAILKHGKKAENYDYWDLDGSPAVGRSNIDVHEQQLSYAASITKKFRSYNKEFPSFDKFILLCEAEQTICLTSKDDADRIIQKAQTIEKNLTGFSASILYINSDGNLSCADYEL